MKNDILTSNNTCIEMANVIDIYLYRNRKHTNFFKLYLHVHAVEKKLSISSENVIDCNQLQLLVVITPTLYISYCFVWSHLYSINARICLANFLTRRHPNLLR